MSIDRREPWQNERQWLGYAGLVPFVVCVALLAWAEPGWHETATDTLRHYAAVIASFLGAVHWGVAADERDPLRRARLRWGVTPALLAWTLLALPDAAALLGFAALFALVLWVDRFLLPVLDDHYRQLRLRLSLVVVASLLLAAALVYQKDDTKSGQALSALTDPGSQTLRYLK